MGSPRGAHASPHLLADRRSCACARVSVPGLMRKTACCPACAWTRSLAGCGANVLELRGVSPHAVMTTSRTGTPVLTAPATRKVNFVPNMLRLMLDNHPLLMMTPATVPTCLVLLCTKAAPTTMTMLVKRMSSDMAEGLTVNRTHYQHVAIHEVTATRRE